MREIKFRAWDRREELMFYSPMITSDDGADKAFTSFWAYIEDNTIYVEDFQIMQYTGLEDRNGKEIYEGDIIFEEYNVMSFGTDLGERKETLIVKIPDFYYWLANAAGDVGEDYIGEYVSEMVVSGNIYENPNLLSQDK